jgi:GNAT superfamily N-acetyltransferase
MARDGRSSIIFCQEVKIIGPLSFHGENMADDESLIMQVLANRLCAQVILFLQRSRAARYSDLLQTCSLDPYHESGKLGYHLNRLISLGLVAKGDSTYTLTDEGRKASQLLEAIKSESRGLFDRSPKRQIKRENVILRGATYSDLQGLIKLGKMAFHDDETDYSIAIRFTDAEGLRTKILRHQGSGKGRLAYVAEHEGEVIACCLVDLMSLARMKAEYIALVGEDELPAELRLPLSEKEKQFYDQYWEAESKFIETGGRTDYIEINYGVTGTWLFPFEPVELIFTQKRLDTEEYITADLKEIFDEILKCRKIMEQAIDIRKQTREAIDGSNPAQCFEILQLLVLPDYQREDLAGMVLRYIEDEASKLKMEYIVTSEDPDEIEPRKFWKDNGFIEIHRYEFKYKHAGRIEQYLLIKKLHG